jgi:hypothetical protein
MAGPCSPAVSSSLPAKRPTLPPQQYAEYQVELGGEIRLACGRRPGIGAHHKQATSRKRPQIPAGQVTQPATDPVAHHRGAHGAAYHEPHPGRIIPAGAHQQVARQQRTTRAAATPDRLGELRLTPHPGRCGKHRGSPWNGSPRSSDANPRAALATARGKHRAAGPGAHAQPKPMRLRAASVVRLKRTLAHWGSRYGACFGRCLIRARQASPFRHRQNWRRGDRTYERYAHQRVPVKRPAPRPHREADRALPLAGATTLFAQHTQEPGPRLWTTVPGGGPGPAGAQPSGGGRRRSGHRAGKERAHNLWKNLLITCGGWREMNSR